MTHQSPTRRHILMGAIAAASINLYAATTDGISRNAESIHQEPEFKAGPARVYTALTDPQQFHKVILLGEAMRTGKIRDSKPTEISREEGGPFSLFGGFISGRHIELVPNVRIVQAWREVPWDEGIYSIVRFQLRDSGAGTRIIFDHTGFPAGAAQHLAEGWNNNYWLPLEKFLS